MIKINVAKLKNMLLISFIEQEGEVAGGSFWDRAVDESITMGESKNRTYRPVSISALPINIDGIAKL